MKITVDMSLYPLNTEYLPIIKETVERLNAAKNVRVVTNAMSTQVTGNFDEVTKLINTEIQFAFERTGQAIFVCKYLKGELDI